MIEEGTVYFDTDYKKELALTMLQCSDEEQMKIIEEAIKYSDDIIRKVLGMSSILKK